MTAETSRGVFTMDGWVGMEDSDDERFEDERERERQTRRVTNTT